MKSTDKSKLHITSKAVAMKNLEDLQPQLMRQLIDLIEGYLVEFNGDSATVLYERNLLPESLNEIRRIYEKAGWKVELLMNSRALVFK